MVRAHALIDPARSGDCSCGERFPSPLEWGRHALAAADADNVAHGPAVHGEPCPEPRCGTSWPSLFHMHAHVQREHGSA